MLDIAGLTQIDSTIFEHACRIAIEQGHADLIAVERLVGELNTKGISEAQIMETEEVLEGRSFIEPQRVIGPPGAYDFGITTYGFEQFAQVGIPNYQDIVTSIVRFVAQEVSPARGRDSTAIASESGQTVFLVEHILKVLAGDGLLKFDGAHEGDLYVFLRIFRVPGTSAET